MIIRFVSPFATLSFSSWTSRCLFSRCVGVKSWWMNTLSSPLPDNPFKFFARRRILSFCSSEATTSFIGLGFAAEFSSFLPSLVQLSTDTSSQSIARRSATSSVSSMLLSLLCAIFVWFLKSVNCDICSPSLDFVHLFFVFCQLQSHCLVDTIVD